MFRLPSFWGSRKRSRYRPLRRRWPLIEGLEERALLSANSTMMGDFGSLVVDRSSYDPAAILVRFRESPGDAGVALAHQSGSEVLPGTHIGKALRGVPGLHKVQLTDGVDVQAALDAYRRHPSVLYAEPDFRVQIALTPGDPQFGSQWGLHNIGQTGGTVDSDIDAPEAWQLSTGSGNTIVAVIDTGVDYTHPDLAGNMWVNSAELNGQANVDDDGNGYVDDIHGYDFINHDGDPRDDQNHGTHVAGIIGAAGNNGLGISGINWNVQIMALKFLDSQGSGSGSDAIEALDYAVQNGATISNNSYGGDPYSQAFADAIERARQAGHIFVAAAGNGNIFGIGQNNDANPYYPASYSADNIIAVAATDHHDNRGFFSNYGAASVDLAAPGVDILSTTRDNTYTSQSGTSMAAPHVTGAVALVRDLHPEWSYQQVIARVLGSVDPVSSLASLTTSGGRLNLAAALVPDVTGPEVVGSDPADLVLDPVDRVRIDFDEAIEVASFTAADVTGFTGPAGPINVLSVNMVANNRQFEIVFPTQTQPGAYTMVIGPGIQDRSGNFMNQDGDQTNGEIADDQYVVTFEIADTVARLDFGKLGSAVAVGYSAVINTDTYHASIGYGWQSGVVYALNRGGDPLTGDLNYTREASFAIDVAAGAYDVIATMGDSVATLTQMGLFLEDELVDSVSTSPGEYTVNVYRVTVSDGQLNLKFQSLSGGYVYLNAIDLVAAGPDTEGPWVKESSPTGTVTGGSVDRISLVFSEPIEASSFTVDDVLSLVGPAGAVPVTAIEQVSSKQFDVVFAAQSEAGDFVVTVGPQIADLAGNLLDQDRDGSTGEAFDDRFVGGFTYESGPTYVARLDFGTSSSPVADGFVGVANTGTYNVAAGFGWKSGLVYSLNRGGDPLTGDFNYTREATFAVDVAAGAFDVTVTLGDTVATLSQMGVFLEDELVDTVNTAKGEYATNTYRVNVNDGQLTLKLKGLSGGYVYVNAAEVVAAGPDTVGPRVNEATPSGTIVGSFVDRISLTFNEPLLEGSFTAEDVASLVGPAGAIAVTSVSQVTSTTYEVVFAPQNQEGDYSLTVGPQIADTSGNLMDQDRDGVSGEVVQDRFTTGFTFEAGPAYVARLDFGTSNSPVAEGYTGATHSSAYNASAGYGWQSGQVYSLNRGGDQLTGDFNYTRDATLAVDVASGSYDVVVTLGDTVATLHDMGVYLEGQLVDSVSTAKGQYATNTYRIDVTDGQLNLRLHGLSGGYVYVNALEVIAVDLGMSAAAFAAEPSVVLFDGGRPQRERNTKPPETTIAASLWPELQNGPRTARRMLPPRATGTTTDRDHCCRVRPC